jgi:hypothetical protein
VLAANGLPAGLAASFGLGDRQTIQVDMTSRDPAVAAWLFERAMYRAREIDTNNPTPALGVYLSVGMNPTLVMDGLRCVLPTG